jgi:serine O-acetyltransferase
MLRTLRQDLQAIFDRDPAVRGWWEALTTYPGWHALWFHRIAHTLWTWRLKWLARLLLVRASAPASSSITAWGS